MTQKQKSKLKKHFKKLPTDLQNIIKKDYLYDLLNIKYEEFENEMEYLSNEWNCDETERCGQEMLNEWNKLYKDSLKLDEIIRNF
jgi:Ca2+-binding EF-hand superfamily protein